MRTRLEWPKNGTQVHIRVNFQFSKHDWSIIAIMITGSVIEPTQEEWSESYPYWKSVRRFNWIISGISWFSPTTLEWYVGARDRE